MFGRRKKSTAPVQLHPDHICKNCDLWDSRHRCHVTWMTTKESDWCKDYSPKTGLKKPIKL